MDYLIKFSIYFCLGIVFVGTFCLFAATVYALGLMNIFKIILIVALFALLGRLIGGKI